MGVADFLSVWQMASHRERIGKRLVHRRAACRHYQNSNLLEQDVLRPRLLRLFGWIVMLVLTKDWLANSAAVLQSIEERLTKGGQM
jgi:very-short-patch-repair endonuclease